MKKEERRKKQEERDAFFAEVQSGYEDTTGEDGVQNTLKEHTTGYEILQQQYNSAPEILREILKYVFEAVKQLPRMEEKELLPVFAAKLTGDPHYFDASTVAERLLFIILSACWQETKRQRIIRSGKKKTRIFLQGGVFLKRMICQMIRLSMESEHGNTMEIFIKESKDFFRKENQSA